MDPVELKIILLRARKSQTQVARELGITPQAINQVLNGYCRSRRIENYILSLRGKKNNSKAA